MAIVCIFSMGPGVRRGHAAHSYAKQHDSSSVFPQTRCTLTHDQATAGNWGMYLLGIPLGKFVDTAGARFGALLGAGLIGGGYGGLRYSMPW